MEQGRRQDTEVTKRRAGCWEQLSRGGLSRWVTDPVYDGLRLSSHFQPIFSLPHSRVIGYESLLRAIDTQGERRAPLALFTGAEQHGESDCLDACAMAMHIANFSRLLPDGKHWLFLNSRPASDAWANYCGLGLYLSMFKLSPSRVVVEILEHAVDDLAALQDLVSGYRELGCLLAVDDFGAGHSNFDRLCRLEPEIVKLDRSMISAATQNPKMRRMLPRMVSLIHEMGSLVLAEGVESHHEAMQAMDAGVDLVQGFYFARPLQGLADPGVIGESVSELWQSYDRRQEASAGQPLQQAAELLRKAMMSWRGGTSLGRACRDFLTLSQATRCYLLDEEGRQVRPNVVLRAIHADCSFHFAPLFDAEGANWSRRSYFRDAVASPGEVQMSRPYLSVNGDGQCVTLSVSAEVKGRRHVLCGDLAWENA